MNAVVFYSNTGHSKAVAEYFESRLNYPLINIEHNENDCYENLVLVFPVHCQNIPDAVKAFLKRIEVTHLTIIATYGKMCCGNVLYEIQNNYQKNIVAGAYVPTKHAYIANDDSFEDFEKLNTIVEKIKEPASIRLPKLYKNPFANLFPNLRSRLGAKIQRTDNCNCCNICVANCSCGAIESGKTNANCIRCFKCVKSCPNQALKIKLRLPLKLYLHKKRQEEIIIYV